MRFYWGMLHLICCWHGESKPCYLGCSLYINFSQCSRAVQVNFSPAELVKEWMKAQCVQVGGSKCGVLCL